MFYLDVDRAFKKPQAALAKVKPRDYLLLDQHRYVIAVFVLHVSFLFVARVTVCDNVHCSCPVSQGGEVASPIRKALARKRNIDFEIWTTSLC